MPIRHSAVPVAVFAAALGLAGLAVTSTASASASETATAKAPAGVLGIDISSWQPHVRWKTVKADHLRFAYVKATEGTYYRSPTFRSQLAGARKEGIVVGAYTFAVPDSSGGAAQARYFAAHGGGRKAGELPGVLDIETNPYGSDKCYGLRPAAMVSWIRAFVDTYHARTGWWPIINTYTRWWNTCTGRSAAFAAKDALWLNAHRRTAAPFPAGWTSYAVWQWAETGRYPCDQDVIPTRLFTRFRHEAR